MIDSITTILGMLFLAYGVGYDRIYFTIAGFVILSVMIIREEFIFRELKSKLNKLKEK